MCLRVRAERDPRVVGHVEPLVPVRRPRVRSFRAGDKVTEPRRRSCPQTEGTVDVEPGARCPRPSSQSHRADRRNRCSRPRPVRRRWSDPPRLRAPRRSSATSIRPSPSAVSGRICAGADAEVAKRPVDGDVAFLADENVDPGARPAVRRGGDSSPPELEHVLARSRERGHVRHLAAGDEAGGHPVRQAEQLAQPFECDLLDDAGARCRPDQARVLVPGRGEPVRRDAARAWRRRSRIRRTEPRASP